MKRIVFAILLFPLVARAEVKPLTTGGFDFERNIVVRGTPTQVYDMITGDLLPWWDHTFSKNPKKLYVEPWPGGGFYEVFDDAGNGVRHASVTWAERGKRLRFEGPLGLTGNALVFVSTYDLSAQRTDSTKIHFTGCCAGKNEKSWADGVDGVWGHFLDALRKYAGTPEALKRKPWPRASAD